MFFFCFVFFLMILTGVHFAFILLWLFLNQVSPVGPKQILVLFYCSTVNKTSWSCVLYCLLWVNSLFFLVWSTIGFTCHSLFQINHICTSIFTLHWKIIILSPSSALFRQLWQPTGPFPTRFCPGEQWSKAGPQLQQRSTAALLLPLLLFLAFLSGRRRLRS